MLCYLKGKILNLETDNILLVAESGIGYEIIINELVYAELSWKNEAEIFIYHTISENNQSLFGFLSLEERKIFKELIKISWVGWRVAITLLSLWLHRLLLAVKNEDEKIIQTIKWVWKKMASKIILEFKDKDFVKSISEKNSENKNFKEIKIDTNIKNQVLESLINMWYSKQNIENAVLEIPENLKKIEEIIPFLIKKL